MKLVRKMFNWCANLWRTYHKIVIILLSILGTLVISFSGRLIGIDDTIPNKITHILYYWSAVILLAYTQETFELRQETTKQEGINRLIELEKLWLYQYSFIPKSNEEKVKILNFFEILAHAYNRNIVDKYLTMTYFATTVKSEWESKSDILKPIRKADPYSC